MSFSRSHTAGSRVVLTPRSLARCAPRDSPVWTFGAALAVSACGALGAPARGDRDLPTSILAGYAAVSVGTSPTGSSALASADDGSIEHPSVIVLRDGRRALYVTHTTSAGVVRIARMIERAPNHLRFEQPVPVLEATQPWEAGAVRAPSAMSVEGIVWLAYAAGGAIGLAQSADGVSFERVAEPVLRPDAAHGEAAALETPSLAPLADGGFALAYASGGAIFLARAARPQGPWTRVGPGPIAAPITTADGGAESLSDPALVSEQTSAGRTLTALAATSRTDDRAPSAIVGFATFDGVTWTRAARALYAERVASVFAGAFDRIDPRTMLLWVGRSEGTRRVVGALITPGGQRAGNPLSP
jgi:hypothetical protein